MAIPPPKTRSNERIKHVSGVVTNFGTALLAAGAVKTYSQQTVSVESGAWIVVGGGLIWVGSQILTLLEPGN